MPPLQQSVTPEDKQAKPQTPQTTQASPMPVAMPPIQRDMDVSRMNPSQVLSLQRSMGNHAVQQLVSSSRKAPVVQAKLEVGPVGDRYEQEAERVAAAVVNAPAQPPQTAQRESDETVQRMGLEEDEEESQE